MHCRILDAVDTMHHIKYCSKKKRRAIAAMINMQGKEAWTNGLVTDRPYDGHDWRALVVMYGKWYIPYDFNTDQWWDGTLCAPDSSFWWEAAAEYLMR